MDGVLPFLASFSCLLEKAPELDNAMAREKETMRRARGRPKKMIRQWERGLIKSAKDTEDELSTEALTITESEEEEKRQTEVVEQGSFLGRDLGAMGRDSGDIAKRPSRELSIRRLEEAGTELSEVNGRESREIYRSLSDLEENLSEDFIRSESEELRERLPEAGSTESEELGKTESEEIGEMKTESAEKMEKGEKEDE